MTKKGRLLFSFFLGLALFLSLTYNNCAKMDSKGADNPSLGGGGGGGGGSIPAGLNWFNTKVKPVFQSNCVGCHTNTVNGGTRIFDYVTMKAMLNGASSISNNLILKTSGQINHGVGGNRCSLGLAFTPCKEIAEWWTAEYGAGGGGGGGPPIVASPIANGEIKQVLSYGKITGVAARLGNLNETVTVSIYLDGAMGTGIAVAVGVPANLLFLDSSSPYDGFHKFEIQLPDSALNGRLHDLYAYATSSTGTIAIGTPFTFLAYRRVAQASFNSFTLNCGACHIWKANQGNSTIAEYSAAFDTLGRPAKADGATATNNVFFIKASGGMSHAGGNQCGNISGGCGSISNWWTAEFGNALYPSSRIR
ncbi:MAG: hypothetical protein SGJ18_14230 [Pseudomonadota bacterium]|nr:hypothetical protein [Pseudomonadota bacterium]